MQQFPGPAQPLIARMTEAALAAPEKAVAYQGAPGANSHIAALGAFPDCLPLPCFGFGDAIDAVREGRADRAIIPIENSQHGRVADMHFLLPESGLVIIGEYFLPIRHAMMSIGERARIRQAISHEQALGQCRHWLAGQGISALAYPDTAGAAARVREMDDPEIAALAPPMAAELYGLTLHEASIADADHNTTRFVVLAREAVPAAADTPMMTTLMFAVKNVPAALYKALGGFATNGINLTKLESYQREGSFAASEFYCDVEGGPGDAALDRALEELRFQTKWVRLLGTYPRARKRGGD
ncbi:prephenate dehydratase [Stakelama pacifica]|uniref:prephenate dehydratase n=1 Tax=Stakelama pacifica TaxID=517720 RepID=A0A4R6FV45_9SPHN|nr:prephenate dehydratase [Stakelama pacifica]MAX00809.1 prephenate dehydratase [Sphingomonas sp.]TDN85672.1 prephenate dehydratase [Stakelama pacifica]GGO91972.1 prephenate dehydratase [Stakelama pacifica]